MAQCFGCGANQGEGGTVTENGRLLCSRCIAWEEQNRKQVPSIFADNKIANREIIAWGIAGVAFIGLLGFGILWMTSKGKVRTVTKIEKVEVPKEVIREVPVIKEVIKVVPKEIIRRVEVPDPKTVAKNIRLNQNLKDVLALFDKKPKFKRKLKGIPSVRVGVFVGKAFAGVLNANTLKTKAELKLRGHGIKIKEICDAHISIHIHGFKALSKSGTLLGYTVYFGIKVSESVITTKRTGTEAIRVDSWTDTDVINFPDDRLESGVKNRVVELIEEFANDYLASNPK